VRQHQAAVTHVDDMNRRRTARPEAEGADAVPAKVFFLLVKANPFPSFITRVMRFTLSKSDCRTIVVNQNLH
jgi:hypothetical protein